MHKTLVTIWNIVMESNCGTSNSISEVSCYEAWHRFLECYDLSNHVEVIDQIVDEHNRRLSCWLFFDPPSWPAFKRVCVFPWFFHRKIGAFWRGFLVLLAPTAGNLASCVHIDFQPKRVMFASWVFHWKWPTGGALQACQNELEQCKEGDVDTQHFL